MGHKPGKHARDDEREGRREKGASKYIHADAHGRTGNFERHLGSSKVEREHHERHERCWGCLVWCMCSGHAVPEEAKGQERSVIRHLALITADYFHESPGCFAWARGLRAIKRETKAEDEAAFLRAAPEPSSWPAEHFALDLGALPPSRGGGAVGSGGAAPPSLAEVARAAAHFAAFATAAYALKLQVLMDPGRTCLNLPFCRVSSVRAFCEMSGIAEEDVIHAEHRARPFKPSWWLCFDRASRAVVVAVRGTFGPSDLLSDALARQVHHNGHVLHEGVLASAQWLLGKLRPRLHGLRELHSGGFRLVITGHSLGGAVAAIATWLLRSEDGLGGRYAAQCFVYGAPLVVDEPLAKLMERFVIGIVHHNDVIPRLGRKSLEDLRDRVAELALSAEQRLSQLEAVLQEFSLPTAPEALREALEAPEGVWQRARSRSGSWHDAAEDVSELPALPMFNPGWQIQLQRRGLRGRALELVPVVSRQVARGLLITGRTPSPAYMQVIRPCLTMWTDHWPQGYQYVCEAFADRLEAKGSSGTKPPLSEVLARLAAYFEGGGGG